VDVGGERREGWKGRVEEKEKEKMVGREGSGRVDARILGIWYDDDYNTDAVMNGTTTTMMAWRGDDDDRRAWMMDDVTPYIWKKKKNFDPETPTVPERGGLGVIPIPVT
jgi:hypothetical protein